MTNNQIPMNKLQTINNLRNYNDRNIRFDFGCWVLEFVCNLEFVICDFSISVPLWLIIKP